MRGLPFLMLVGKCSGLTYSISLHPDIDVNMPSALHKADSRA